MPRSLFVFSCLILMLCSTVNITAAEQFNEQLSDKPISKAVLDKSININTNDQLIEPKIVVLDPIETVVIVSPLVTEQDIHSRLHISSIDTAHKLYPVKIISIDKWLVPKNIFEQDLRLKEGEHQIIVVPDFSNVTPQSVMMSSIWQEKRITFALQADQDIVISARLMDLEQLQWEVQLYSVLIPTKNTEKSLEN